MFDLPPGNTSQTGKKVDGGFLLLVQEYHLLVVQLNPLPPFFIVFRLVGEDWYEVVSGDVTWGGRRWSYRRCRHGGGMGEVRSGGTELAGQRNSRSATNVKAVIACKR